MSTIIYDHNKKQIACDSRSSAGIDIRSDKTIKWTETSSDIWFFAGIPAHKAYVLEKTITTDDIGIDFEIDLVALRFKKHTKEVFFHCYHDKKKMTVEIMDHSFAIGSGYQYALAALDFGKTAKEAVEYSSTRDMCTGGKVHVLCCDSGKFLEGS